MRSATCVNPAVRRRCRAALGGKCALPLIVAVVGIGIGTGALSDAVGASLIGAGMISVLVFPLLGTRIAGVAVPAGHASDESDEY